MRKLLSLAVSIAFLYSCSTSTDSNGNSSTTVVPLPPTNLIGTLVSPIQINLSWTDNSTNETVFKIERKTGSGNYTILGTTAADITNYNDVGLTPNTTYTYRVYSSNNVGSSLTYSNELTLMTGSIIELPTLMTTTVSSISTTTAVSGGTISSDGGAPITARGVCWSTSTNPTIELATKTTDGTGTGVFTSAISGLSPNTLYYVRVYATNSLGTAYGNEINFTSLQNSAAINIPGPNVTDVDGNVYQTITNCGQTWTRSNLNVSHYRNGDAIPQVTDLTQWTNLTTGAWCYYANTSSNGIIYGRLYNWYAVNDPRGLAPVGYHIPSDDDWTTLTTCLGGETIAAGAMKEVGTSHWQSPNTGATNSSGFTSLPGGNKLSLTVVPTSMGYQAWFWSSTEYDSTNAWFRYMLNDSVQLYRASYDFNKSYGFSVRCVKD
ncbi:MAG: hypothetical protein RL427_803 [Bacteroidota bacterium]|jgi:uncharacterized protein (TIGR02145 family)